MKIIVSEFMSLDGVMESPGPDGSGFAYEGWTMPYASETFMKFKQDELLQASALLLGRVTYDGFAAAWPKMKDTGDFGERMNSIPKYIVSGSTEKLEWENSKVISVEEIPKLKQEPGKDICVFGSSMLVRTLMERGLVDEYRLLVYPIVLGVGKHLFKEGVYSALTLTETKPLDKGVVLLRYEPAVK
jgi:dihydrofolate reductase